MIPAPACETTRAHDGSSSACGTYGTTSTFAGCGPSDDRVDARSGRDDDPDRQAAQAGERRRQHSGRLVEHGAEGQVDDGIAAGGEEVAELIGQPLPGSRAAERRAQQTDVRPLIGGRGRQRRRADPQVGGGEDISVGRPGQLGDHRRHPLPHPRRQRHAEAVDDLTGTRHRGGDGAGQLHLLVDHEVRRPRHGARHEIGGPATPGRHEVLGRQRSAATRCLVGPPDRPRVEAVGLDVGDELGPGRDDDCVTGVARRHGQRQDRVDVAVHRAAAEEDPHRAMMRPVGPAVMERAWRSSGGQAAGGS